MDDSKMTKPEEEQDDPDLDVDLLEYLLSLSPGERVRRHAQALELVRALRQAAVRHYGFDPRNPEAPH